MVHASLVKPCAIVLCAAKPCVQRGLQCSTAKFCNCSEPNNNMEINTNYHSFYLYFKKGSSVTGAAGTVPQLGHPVSESVLNGLSFIVSFGTSSHEFICISSIFQSQEIQPHPQDGHYWLSSSSLSLGASSILFGVG